MRWRIFILVAADQRLCRAAAHGGHRRSQESFLDAAGPRFRRWPTFRSTMAIALDRSRFQQVQRLDKPEFREWLIKDLKAAQNAGWRFRRVPSSGLQFF